MAALPVEAVAPAAQVQAKAPNWDNPWAKFQQAMPEEVTPAKLDYMASMRLPIFAQSFPAQAPTLGVLKGPV